MNRNRRSRASTLVHFVIRRKILRSARPPIVFQYINAINVCSAFVRFDMPKNHIAFASNPLLLLQIACDILMYKYTFEGLQSGWCFALGTQSIAGDATHLYILLLNLIFRCKLFLACHKFCSHNNSVVP